MSIRIKSNKVIVGNNYDYQFEFCNILDDKKLEFGIEENLNEYIMLSTDDENYEKKLSLTLNRIKNQDYDFYKKIMENMND